MNKRTCYNCGTKITNGNVLCLGNICDGKNKWTPTKDKQNCDNCKNKKDICKDKIVPKENWCEAWKIKE